MLSTELGWLRQVSWAGIAHPRQNLCLAHHYVIYHAGPVSWVELQLGAWATSTFIKATMYMARGVGALNLDGIATSFGEPGRLQGIPGGLLKSKQLNNNGMERLVSLLFYRACGLGRYLGFRNGRIAACLCVHAKRPVPLGQENSR